MSKQYDTNASPSQQEAGVRFLIRWKKGHLVFDGAGQERKILLER